ncbi:MAG: TonB-dependent receptor, partial [Proteobacteria bacterium]|nr:TonB-dependent receptor [Pseudomonadota bacterium]
RALQLDSGSGLAYAQRAVIDVAQNRKDEALANGRRAVELSPDMTAASIALSYALQANYQLGEARQTLEKAVADNPNDALARARLAELWLMIGYRDRAREEAEKAVELQPGLERAQVVLGFAALTEIRTSQAKEAFSKAIALDSDDPMPHLGLGLATIREGDLAQGRKQIEAAVALDPENALLRSYLGKAYFDEKRKDLDAQQLALAKERDPNDPTAYLYDALRKQSENRPGEALQDLQKSIELNDNRAVYRGRLQLDEDRAARGASLANIYSDLGFTRSGLNEATKSLNDDPTNASAHRFLSDTYAGMRRHEIARVSEQLQAQMLQDININPVSPSGSTANLGTGGTAGFNEYTSLFERNQVQFNGFGGYGTDETATAEGVVSAVHDWLSVSAGAYHYQTDGWRQNAGIEHDIQNIYAQAALTPDLNIQLEYWTRESTAGDVVFRFDPNSFSATQARNLDQDIARAGIRYSPSPNSDILFSYIYSDRLNKFTDNQITDFGLSQLHLDISEPTQDESHLFEAQYLHRAERLNVVAGAALSLDDRDQDSSVVVAQNFPGFFPGCNPLILPPVGCFVPPFPAGTVLGNVQGQQDIEHSRGYVYLNANYPDSVTWTLGASYDNLDFDVAGAEVTEFNPKFGVQWDVTDRLRLRGAAFQVVKPAIFANRTIEPTQIAGFNQLFDDSNGTVSKGYGLGIDWRATDMVHVGVEAMGREFSEMVQQITGPTFTLSNPVDREEQIYRGYVSWLPIPSIAVTAEAVFDRYTSDPGAGDDFFPKEVRTFSLPVNVAYFHPGGFLARAGATFIDQEVERHPASFLPVGEDSFITVDAMIGWRLKNRAGMISLEGRNLFDTQFNYLDDSYREFRDEPTPSPYLPERTIMGRLTLKF